MSDDGFDLLAAMSATIDAYKQRERIPPPQPLLIPTWMPAVVRLECGLDDAGADEWLDRTAREYGFDGYAFYAP